MGSGLGKLDVWNIALDHLRERPLGATTDDRAEALWLNRNYNQQRDYMLGRGRWGFARERAMIAAETVNPAFGWNYRYTAPLDLIRLIPPTLEGDSNGRRIPFLLEGAYIMSDYSGPLPTMYIKRITNEGLMTNNFIEVLALRLSLRMSHWLTGKANFTDKLQNWYAQELKDALGLDALESQGQQYYDDDVIAVRYT